MEGKIQMRMRLALVPMMCVGAALAAETNDWENLQVNRSATLSVAGCDLADAKLYDADGKLVGKFTCGLAPLAVPDVRLWSSEHPYLYTLVLRKGDDIRMKRVGFKEQKVVGNRFLVNGQPVKFKGVNRRGAALRAGAPLREGGPGVRAAPQRAAALPRAARRAAGGLPQPRRAPDGPRRRELRARADGEKYVFPIERTEWTLRLEPVTR